MYKSDRKQARDERRPSHSSPSFSPPPQDMTSEMVTHQPAAYDMPPAYPARAPEVHLHPPPPQQMTAAQLGEQYRAELFAQCAQGVHDPKKKYGLCGIITAVLCFPCGLICLFTDSEKRCARCGVKLE